jgi:hypothetical protein
MATETRKSEKSGKDIGTGPYLAKVVSHLDPSFMGGLEVTLLRESGNSVGDDTQTYTVKCATPFYGSTAYEFMGNNVGNDSAYNDTQKSYGMWFVPPDVGVTVLVTFIDGQPSDGYWFACIPSKFGNQMVPAIGATTNNDASPAQKEKYATSSPLPVAEINRKANDLSQNMAVDKIKKAVHPIADRFLEQGLLEDDTRGYSTTSARREVPNMSFGILSPGPLDRRPGATKKFIGTKQDPSKEPVPVSRMGGTQFVMDDGDGRYQRKKPASEGPSEYADTQNRETGDPDIPFSEYFRVRTRTGHQILLHNSEDLIYIGNARGTTWIELTSNGKVDIFAEDSISVHTKNDLNIRADRDINLEAGRNVNIKAAADYSKDADKDDLGFDSGRVQIESRHDTKIIIGKGGKITTKADLEIFTTQSNNLTAGVSTNILSTVGHFETAGVIHMNGVPATPAVPATALPTHKNLVTDKDLKWSATKYFQQAPLTSIIKRIPMHEPWPLHENYGPKLYTPNLTDRELE